MNEQDIRSIVRQELQSILGNVNSAPIELLQAIDLGARAARYMKESTSNTTVASVTQPVDENGTATYDVCKIPTGFILVEGTSLNIPYY